MMIRNDWNPPDESALAVGTRLETAKAAGGSAFSRMELLTVMARHCGGDDCAGSSVGRALLQTPSGKLVVTGEQRQHSVLERVLDMRGTSDARDDQVSLRTVYRRNLNP